MTIPTVTNLVSDVQTKISSKRLIQLTNPGSPSATSVNTTLLNEAAKDASLFFEEVARHKYDDDNIGHRYICWQGVIAFLYSYEGQRSPNANETMATFKERCERFIQGNKSRVKAGSKLAKSAFSDQDQTQNREPYFREGDFDDIRPL